MTNAPIMQLLSNLNILLVDHNAYMRRVTRMMLVNIGARSVIEATDGLNAIERIRACNPDIMLLDWDLPLLSGKEIMNIVRAPGMVPRPSLPTIVLTSHANPAQIREALRVGVHEFLVKPTSAKALCDRLVAIITKPRPMVTVNGHNVPEPRGKLQSRAAQVLAQIKIELSAEPQLAVGQ